MPDITPTRIRHDTTGGVTIVPRWTFDDLWEPAGWDLAPEGAAVTVAGTHSSGRRVGRVKIEANYGPVVVDSLNLDPIPSLVLHVPATYEPVELAARLTVSHTVANAQVTAAIAPVGSSNYTHIIGAHYATTAAVGKFETLTPTAELDPGVGGDYQVFVFGDAGSVTVAASVNWPAVFKARTE